MSEEKDYINNGLEDDVQWYKDCYPSNARRFMAKVSRRVQSDKKDDEDTSESDKKDDGGDLNETDKSTEPEPEPECKLSLDEWLETKF